MKNHQSPVTNHGFTLIEVMVGVLIATALGVGLIGLKRILYENEKLVLKNYLNVENANQALTNLAREVRTTRAADNGFYPISLATSNELIFYSDVDYDSNSERVRYTLNGPNLEKGIIKPVGYPATYPTENEKTKIIANNVDNQGLPVFTYYNGNWPEDIVTNPLTEPINVSQMKLIEIYLRLVNEKSEYSLKTYAQTRTLKNNL